ncbi:hypothetical protein EV360DRAFT_40397 [Lentinula raphanica]|nr:hypothetical protein EV360DRAFT_40397 [Lentinula raphanica]
MLHSTTIVSRSSTAVLSHLNRIKSQYATSPHTFLFALSVPTHSSELSSLVDTLMTFSPTSSLGCLSSPLVPGYISCSVALLDPRNATLFRSTIPGREQTQVGRWHAFRRKDDGEYNDFKLPEGNFDWEDLWKTTRTNPRQQMPDELTRLDTERVSSVLYLSDLSPEGLSSVLSSSFPKASQLGLLASSTPFITGRPVTLFHNQHILDKGAVGVALTSHKALKFHVPNDIRPLGSALEVTDSEGNLVNTLNLSNPTQLLLSRIRAAGIDTTSSNAITFKDDTEFYLGVLPHDSSTPYQLHAITAGDPSRGTLSLNPQTMALPVGTQVQFFHRPVMKTPSLGTWQESVRTLGGTVAFTALSSTEVIESGTDGEGEDGLSPSTAGGLVLENRFIVGSDNGVVMKRAGEHPWSCTVPGCISEL